MTRFISSFQDGSVGGFWQHRPGCAAADLRHIGIAPERLTIVTAEDKGNEEAAKYGIKFVKERLTRENFRRVLNPLLGRGDFLINVSVRGVERRAHQAVLGKGRDVPGHLPRALAGRLHRPDRPRRPRTNYALREEALALRAGNARAPTAVLTHGANPGLVSHFVKQALLNIAADTKVEAGKPSSRAEWGELARRLSVKVIHIAERDTQISAKAEATGRNSSTPGRSTASSARARSRVRWAGHARAQLSARRQAP